MEKVEKLNPIYVLRHPFEGYHKIKSDKLGSLTGANLVLGLWFVAAIMRRQLTNFRFNTNNLSNLNIFYIALSTLVVFVFGCAANWAFCTLLDGKGTFKEIWISAAYGLLPYILSIYVTTLISHFMVIDEKLFIDVITIIGISWSACMIFLGLMEIHQYRFATTLFSIILTAFGILFIVFVCVLVFTLFQQIVIFITSLYNEILFRI